MDKGKWHQKDFVEKQIMRKFEYFIFSSNELKDDKLFVMQMIQKKPEIFQFLSDKFKDDKELSLLSVSLEGMMLEHVSLALKHDKDVVRAAVSKNGNALKFASERLKDDKELVLNAIKNDQEALEHASEKLKNDKEVVLAAVKNWKSLKYASDELRNDKEVVLAAVKNGRSLKYASDELRNDKEVVLAAVKNWGYALEYASDRLKDDIEVVMQSIGSYFSGTALLYASDRLKNDKNLCLYAISESEFAYRYIGNNLKNDKEIVIAALQKDYKIIETIPENLKKDKEVALAAVSSNGYALEYLNDDFKNDKDVVSVAVSSRGLALEYASNALKRDIAICSLAIKNDIDALKYVDEKIRNVKEIIIEKLISGKLEFNRIRKELKSDRDVMIAALSKNKYYFEEDEFKHLTCDKEAVVAAVSHDPSALYYACEQLKDDKEVVLEAVKQSREYHEALSHASERLKNDREVVLKAVNTNGTELQYASDTLKNDREIVMNAITKKPSVFKYASDHLRGDRKFALIAVSKYGYNLEYVGESLKSDREIVSAATNNTHWAFRYAKDHIKCDREFIESFISTDETCLILIDVCKEVRSDLSFMKLLMQKNILAKEFIIFPEQFSSSIMDYFGKDLLKDTISKINSRTISSRYSSSIFDIRLKSEIDNGISIHSIDPNIFVEKNELFPMILKYIKSGEKHQIKQVYEMFENSIKNNDVEVVEIALQKELIDKNNAVYFMNLATEINNPFINSLLMKYTINHVGDFQSKLEDDREVLLKRIKKAKKLKNEEIEKIEKHYLDDYEIIIESLKFEPWIYKKLSDQLKYDKQITLEAVKNDGSLISNTSDTLKDDFDVVFEAFKNDQYALSFASERIKSEKDYAYQFVKISGFALRYLDDSIKRDKALVMEAVKQDGLSLQFASVDLQRDKDILFEAIEQNYLAYEYVDDSLQYDPELIRMVFPKIQSYDVLTPKMKRNRPLCLLLVKKNPRFFEYNLKMFKEDLKFKSSANFEFKYKYYSAIEERWSNLLSEIVRTFSETVEVKFSDKETGIYHTDAFLQVGDQVRVDDRSNRVGEVVGVVNTPYVDMKTKSVTDIIESVDNSYVGNCDLRTQITSNKAIICRLLAKNFLADPDDIISNLIKFKDFWYESASSIMYHDDFMRVLHYFHNSFEETLFNDKRFMTLMISMEPRYICFASEPIKKDLSLVVKSLSKVSHGDYVDTFKEVIAFHQNVKTLIISSVSIDGFCLDVLNDENKDDREVVLRAVKNNGLSLAFASERLKNDYDIVLSAVKQNGAAIEYASTRMQSNTDILNQKGREKELPTFEKIDEIQSEDFVLDLEEHQYAVLNSYIGSQETLTIPSTIIDNDVYCIGKCAFEGNKHLKKVIIQDGVKFIDEFAFRGCVNLEEVILPETLHSLEEGVFEGCLSLKSITIPENVGFIKKNLCKNNTSLRSVKLPKYITYIDEFAFADCPNLAIDNSDSEILYIHKDAFDSKKVLKKANINEIANTQSIISNDHQLIVEIDFGLNKKYKYNSNLWVNIGDLVIVSGKVKDQGRVVGVEEGWNSAPYMQQIIEVITPKKVEITELKPSPSQLIDQVKTSEIISNNIEKIEKDIQEEHTVNESVTSEKIVFAATGKFEKFTRETLKIFIEEKGHSLLDKISKNANYLINNDITSESSKNKFAKENNIPIITEKDLIKLLSPNLNEVSDTTQREPSTEAKSNPVVIETITKTDDFGIYIDRFLDASGIKKSDVEKITEKSKKVLLLSEDGLTVRKIRKDNKNNIIVISEGVETIAKEAFKENDVVEYLLLPKSLKMIENYAFSKCTKLTYVGVPNIELSFGSHTFSGCKSLKKIDLPDDAILGESTFEQTGLESVICKSKYNRIPRRCFSEIESLKEVVIENNIKDIATKAFSGCTQLKSIHIPTSVEKMGEDVFDTCLELKITSEHLLKPVGWNEHWNPMYRPIAWGYIKDSGKDPVYKQEAKPPKIIYIVALRFGGANVQVIYTEDNVEVKDKVCIKGTSKCGKVLSKKPASSQRYIRENQKLVELKKV